MTPLLQTASALFEGKPAWGAFHDQVFGPSGLVREHYANLVDRGQFQRTGDYAELLGMLADLRDADKTNAGAPRVITVRLPRSLHQTLLLEAAEQHTSLNKLCVSKLLRVLDAAENPAPRAEAPQT